MKRLVLLTVVTMVIAAASGAQMMGTYTVKKGDSLAKIAKVELGDSRRWTEIARLNNIRKPWTIFPGQTLNLGNSTAYVTPTPAMEMPARMVQSPPTTATSYPAAAEPMMVQPPVQRRSNFTSYGSRR